MKSGSQAPPGVYFALPLFYQADYSSLRGPAGNRVPLNLNTTINLFAPVIAVTTKWKVAGAHYGFQIVPLIMNQRFDLAATSTQTSSGYNFGDTYVQPVTLGWSKKRADFVAGYGIFIPTGVGDRSLEMFGHELSAGSTIYFDEAKKWHGAATMFYEMHQRKRTNDVRVGDFLTIEGGIGRAFLKGAANAGLAYVMQWKTTDDTGSTIPPALRGKNKAYAVGPEINLPFVAKGKLVGLFGFRYTFEMGNSANFQGNNLVASITLAKLN